MLRFCAVFALLVTMLPLGGCRNDEVVALPWADAKVEGLATLDNPWAMASWALMAKAPQGTRRACPERGRAGAASGIQTWLYDGSQCV
jgi:hypothetical protein